MTWASATIRSTLMLGEPRVLGAWPGKRPIVGRWMLHYWGHPMSSWLPKSLQPNGKVGHQYLECAGDAEVMRRYGELLAALKKKVPKLATNGPAPDDPKLVSRLAKTSCSAWDPKYNSLQIALERASWYVRAEAALDGDQEMRRDVIVLETDAGSLAFARMVQGVYATVASKDIVITACGKAEAKRLLPAVLARTGFEEKRAPGSLTIEGKQLAIGATNQAGNIALTLACRPGRYRFFTGESDDHHYLRLRA